MCFSFNQEEKSSTGSITQGMAVFDSLVFTWSIFLTYKKVYNFIKKHWNIILVFPHSSRFQCFSYSSCFRKKITLQALVFPMNSKSQQTLITINFLSFRLVMCSTVTFANRTCRAWAGRAVFTYRADKLSGVNHQTSHFHTKQTNSEAGPGLHTEERTAKAGLSSERTC